MSVNAIGALGEELAAIHQPPGEDLEQRGFDHLISYTGSWELLQLWDTQGSAFWCLWSHSWRG
jgi:hypothetical protein